MDPDAALKAFLDAMRAKDRDAVGEAAGSLGDWLETMGYFPDFTGWLVGLGREQLVSYFRDCQAIAEMPGSGLRAAFDAEKGPRFLVRDESGRGGSVGDLSASEVVERFGEDFDDAAEDEDRLADLVEQLGVTGEVRIDGATVVVRVS